MNTKILLVEPEAIIREGLTLLLTTLPGVTLVRAVSTAEMAVFNLQENAFDILITEMALPLTSGIELIQRAMKEKSPPRCLVLAHFLNEVSIRNAIAVGAKGVLSKGCTKEELERAIADINGGQQFVGSGLTAQIEREVTGIAPGRGSDPLSLLSKREREIFHLLADGVQNATIAKQLFISPRTVETHRARIVRKIGVRTNSELIRYAIRSGVTGV